MCTHFAAMQANSQIYSAQRLRRRGAQAQCRRQACGELLAAIRLDVVLSIGASTQLARD